MTKQQFNDEFVRQFTSNDRITPFDRIKHTYRAAIAYTGSSDFWDMPESEKVTAAKVFLDQLRAYEVLHQHYDFLFTQKAYFMRRIYPDVLKGANFATFNEFGKERVQEMFGKYILE